ncbi:Nn.00g057940.m01.CDS01 [Neocucurbitaria sp. VM-36]
MSHSPTVSTEGDCPFMKLPLELRQTIWRYALATDNGVIALCQSDKKRFISRDLETPMNRISEICRQFQNDARFLELGVNDLWCQHKEGQDLVELLKMSDKYTKHLSFKVIYYPIWGFAFPPTKDILHGLLAYAKGNEKISIDIRLFRWYITDQRPKFIREFVKFGIGLRRAIRGIKFGPVDCGLSVEKAWRFGKPLSDMNVPGVRFWPRELALNDDQLMKVRSACKIVGFKKVLMHYSIDSEKAIENLMEEVKDWYKNGI